MKARVEMKRESDFMAHGVAHRILCEQRLFELEVQFVTLNGSIMGESEGLRNQL